MLLSALSPQFRSTMRPPADVTAWPGLPEPIRAGILAMVRAAKS
jgi:hypothetical protein